MTKNTLAKATMCLVTALLIASNVPVKAAEIKADTAVAGITVSLDKFYAATLEKQMEDIANDVLMGALSLKANEDTINSSTSVEETTQSQEDNAAEIKPVSQYENMGISIANDYVNIRSNANEESKILGKLYQGSAATILKTEGEWVKIKSGTVEGYIKATFLAIGEEAEKVAEKYGKKQVTITTTTLKVREEKNINSSVLTLIPEGETYDVIKEYKEWVKVQIDEDIIGFVCKSSGGEQLVEVTMSFDKAISVEEEMAKLAAEEARRAEQEAAIAARNAQSSNNQSSDNKSTSNSTPRQTSSPSNTQPSKSEPSKVESRNNSNSSDIVSYAMNFLGNPYVYGGTSLTNGTDCSGFTMQIYSHFGYSIPRTSRDQANAGSSVSLDSVKAGDLIFYTGSGGSVNHVAMYIGGGQVIHASTRRTGIKISNMYYRTPLKARRIMN